MPRGFVYPDDPDVWVLLERALADAFAGMPDDQQRAIGVLEVLSAGAGLMCRTTMSGRS